MKKYIVLIVFLLCGCKREECVVNKYPYEANYKYSASIVYNYMDYYLKGKELMKSINNSKGMLSISTINPDNTSNVSFFTMMMPNNSYAIATFQNDNQTAINLRYKPQAMITYIEYRDDTNDYLNYVGARIIVDCLIYEDDISAFETAYGINVKENQYVFKILEIRPLG